MNTMKNIVVTMTLAAIAISGTAQAREAGGGDRMQRDNARVEQRTERRTDRVRNEPAARREGRRDSARLEQRGERRAYGVRNERTASREGRRDHGDGYGRVDRRQDKQRGRIAEGRRSGELNRGESHRLRMQQRKIGRMEHRFSSDGHLSGRERRYLEHAQDRASKRIARFKHNDIYRGSGHRYARSYNRHQGHKSRYRW